MFCALAGWLLNVEQRNFFTFFRGKGWFRDHAFQKFFIPIELYSHIQKSLQTHTFALTQMRTEYKECARAISMENEWLFLNVYPFIMTRKFMKFTYLDIGACLLFRRRFSIFILHSTEMKKSFPFTLMKRFNGKQQHLANEQKSPWMPSKKLFSIISIELVCEY